MLKLNVRDVDPEAFISGLNSESDRACGVLGASLMDARLEALFASRLRDFHKELFGSSGPLSTFSGKIRLAYALTWIGDDVRADLDAIRAIRNEFAHSFDHTLRFEEPSISDRCSNLRVARAFLEGYDIAASAPRRSASADVFRAMQRKFSAARLRFQLTIEFIDQYLAGLTQDRSEDPDGDFLAEVRAVSAGTTFVASATATVAERAPTDSQNKAR
jgi:hypothetical protein